jgi:hypothetical protein
MSFYNKGDKPIFYKALRIKANLKNKINMPMRTKLTVMITFLIISTTVISQDSIKPKINEYYLGLAGFSPLSIQLKYKRQIKEKTFFKVGLIELFANTNSRAYSNSSQSKTNYWRYSAGLEIGIEFRKLISNRFSLYHGPNINYSYSRDQSRVFSPILTQEQQKTSITRNNFSLPYTLGILFNVTSNILISAEINPAISYAIVDLKNGQNPSVNTNESYVNFNFSNRLGLLSIVYRP